MATAQQSRPDSHGSRTLTINQISTNEAGPSNQTSNPPVGVLKLRGGPSRKAKVEWSEEVVDNEGMGRKKSKICCIYNKPRAFDESSSESGSGSEDDRETERRRAEGKDKGKGKTVRRKIEGEAGGEEVSEPESESDGGGGDGRARPARKSTRRRHRHHHDHDHVADGHGCADHAAKPNKYDVQPRGAQKVLPTT